MRLSAKRLEARRVGLESSRERRRTAHDGSLGGKATVPPGTLAENTRNGEMQGIDWGAGQAGQAKCSGWKRLVSSSVQESGKIGRGCGCRTTWMMAVLIARVPYFEEVTSDKAITTSLLDTLLCPSAFHPARHQSRGC